MQQTTWIFATHNTGKAREVEGLLQGLGCHLRTLADLNLPSPEETGLTFVENALLKARYAAQQTGLPALADDSGLVVPALNGAPGLYSARYAGKGATDDDNNQKLLQTMRGMTTREAYYICVMVYLRAPTDPDPLICLGRWCGQITQETRGTGGFGYDPVFYIPALQKTAAECSRDEKNRYSHRAQALQHLIALLTA